MGDLFLHYAVNYTAYLYVIIFLMMLFEGEGVLFVSTYLLHLGYLSLPILLPVVIAGLYIGDYLWFHFGGLLIRKVGFVQKWSARLAPSTNNFILKRTFHTLLVVRFTYGLCRITLVRAGMIGLDLKKFIRADIPAGAIWMVVIGGLGYASSASFEYFRHYLKFAEVGILIGLLLLVTATRVYSKWEIKKIKRLEM